MKRLISLTILVCLLGLAGFSFGHSGRTDDKGCHYDHSTGQYHCH